MAIVPNNLGVGPTTVAPQKRIYATKIEPKTFAASVSAKELKPGVVMAYNTGTNLWEEWANGGANGLGTIRGIVWPNPVNVLAAGQGEVVGNIMLAGAAHYADLIADGGTLAQLKTALRTQTPSLRELGIHIEGLTNVS